MPRKHILGMMFDEFFANLSGDYSKIPLPSLQALIDYHETKQEFEKCVPLKKELDKRLMPQNI